MDSNTGVARVSRVLSLILLDIVCCIAAFALATWFLHMAVEGGYGLLFKASSVPNGPLEAYFTNIQAGVFVALFILSFACFRLYSSIWSVSGLNEGIMAIAGVGVGTCLCLIVNYLLSLFPETYKLGFRNSERTGILLAGIFICMMVFVTRFGYRGVRRILNSIGRNKNKDKKATLIIGAGYFGAYVQSQINNGQSATDCYLVGFVDDNKSKLGMRIGGVKVLGTSKDIPAIVKQKHVEEIIIAIPSLSSKDRAELVTTCRDTKCHVRIVSPLNELSEKPSMKDLNEINISDMLFRPEVNLDVRSIEGIIEHKCLLVTGGGGSIGSEICRQAAVFYPATIVIFDIYENNAYELYCELKQKRPWLNVVIRIGSVRDKDRVDAVMEEFHPDIVVHTAAHKHVPLMEDSPAEAVKNNVIGTINVLESADSHGVKRFVMLSTDKAVNPTNVMGATKRITELIVQQYARKSIMRCMTVRFGNVLGSHGSVIPLFERQIKQGGPVLVTDKNITRYFMTIPEASQLVLQAGALGESGAIYVLDMGEPVKIYELAEKVIRFHGYEPNVDMPIEIIGLRPGEKMYEELLTDDEQNAMEKTAHGRIFKALPEPVDAEAFDDKLAELCELARMNSSAVIDCISEIVPNFDHKENRVSMTA
ncbi:MAG: polysaccharide biosynthesis protein [Clostridia bacterium]|nr:polysaccharide biosynthesis protein [Clostridia bacterium]MBR5713521.1 polysaccharide biosynthesis protein [Clostridia bacterium]